MMHTVVLVVGFGLLLSVAEAANPTPAARVVGDGGLRGAVGWIALYVAYVPLLGSLIVAVTVVAARYSPTRVAVATVPSPVRLFASFVLAEVFVYWLHRWSHSVPLLWRVHAVHHGSQELRWWTSYRFHPIDTALSHAVPAVGVALFGFSPDLIAVHAAVVIVVTLFAHADVYIPPSPLSRLVVTPGFHRAHHHPASETRNLALVLPLVDLVFGTASWVAPSAQQGATNHQRADVR